MDEAIGVLSGQMSSMDVQREKEWEEMDILEKVERLKRLVEVLIRKDNEKAKRISDLLKHNHLDGHIVIPLRTIL